MEDLSRSLAFTALLNLSPEFGKMTDPQSTRLITLLVCDFRLSGQTNMYDYAARWVVINREIIIEWSNNHVLSGDRIPDARGNLPPR